MLPLDLGSLLGEELACQWHCGTGCEQVVGHREPEQEPCSASKLNLLCTCSLAGLQDVELGGLLGGLTCRVALPTSTSIAYPVWPPASQGCRWQPYQLTSEHRWLPHAGSSAVVMASCLLATAVSSVMPAGYNPPGQGLGVTD